jgi:DNA-directed RNA polymerase specialized sigma24 family protein
MTANVSREAEMQQQFNNPINNNKETTATTITPLTPAQRRYVEAVYAHLCKTYGFKIAKASLRGHKPADVANFAIQKVIRNVQQFMARYPTPDHAANAVAPNAFVDYCRRDNAQSGRGARGTRMVIGDEPGNYGDDNAESIIARQPGVVVDPEAWVERDYHDGIIGEVREHISTLAWEGLVLTEINELTQGEAAKLLGVSRAHLNREISKAKKIAKRMHEDHNWEVN